MPPFRLDRSVPLVDACAADELPEFVEAAPASIAFEPRRVGGGSGAPRPIALLAWVAGLLAIGGIGLLAGDPPAPTRPVVVADAGPEATGRIRTGLPSTYMGAMLTRDAVALASPAPDRVEVTTRQVAVSGSVLVKASRVEIFLEARGNRVIDHLSVDVTDPNGGVRPEYAATFEAAFDLPNPRPNGTMWVVVTAYDGRGMPLGGTRRPFAVGPLLEPEPTSAP